MSINPPSHGDSTALRMRAKPSGVRVNPQWFSSARITPHSAAFGRHCSMQSMHHLNPSSSVCPGSTGSSPRAFIKSSNDAIVFHRPEFNRMHGTPN